MAADDLREADAKVPAEAARCSKSGVTVLYSQLSSADCKVLSHLIFCTMAPLSLYVCDVLESHGYIYD